MPGTATATDAIQSAVSVAWQPQPGPQTLLMICPYEEIFYGGARGGGKTSGLLGHWLKHAHRWGAHAKGIIFRRTYDELEEIMEQAQALFPLVGGHYQSGKKTWIFRNGAKLLLRFLDKDDQAKKYLGRAYTWMGMEEITNWPSSDPVDKLKACLRSSHGVKCQWVATGNPGGVGHNWVKARFIDPMPPFTPYRDPVTDVIRIFIPAKLQDNQLLLKNDPTYVNRLKASGPEWLVKAWLDGNWDIVAGGMFDDLWNRSVHVLEPFKCPSSWTIDRAFDWGSARPFSIGWWATCNGEQVQGQRPFFRGTKIRIAEWYGWDGKTPNKGLNMIDSEIARKALAMEEEMKKAHGYTFTEGPADPSIFTVTNGTSIGQTYNRLGLTFKPAATGAGSRVAGWAQMRTMLKASLKQPIMEEPGLFVFSSCRQFIRTVPTLPRDLVKIDDVDTDAEDHVGDETRYELTTKKSTITIQKLVGV
jgi:Terminase-like family.